MNSSAVELLHHSLPLTHNGQLEEELELPPLAPVDEHAARQPFSPGMRPARHMPLPPTVAYQLIVPDPAEYMADDLLEPLQSPPPELVTALGGTPVASSAPAVAVSPAVDDQDDQTADYLFSGGIHFDAVFAFLIYIALALGTLYLDIETRYLVLWTVLIVAGVLLVLVDRPDAGVLKSAGLGWGVSIGLVFSLPLLILNGPGLRDISLTIFPSDNLLALFQTLIYVAPLSETLFFRGFIQEQRGFTVSVLAVGVSSILFYWPAASGQPVFLVAAVVFSTVLAAIYSFFRMRLGLSAAFICHVTINFSLLFMPRILF